MPPTAGCWKRDPEFDEARGRLVEALLQPAHGRRGAGACVEYLRQRRPGDPRLDVYLARCRESLGQWQEAERILDGVLARHPQHGPALFERAQLALREGQVEMAEHWLREAVVREPGDYRTRYVFFQCLQHNGKAAEAAEEQRRLDQVHADMERIQEIAGRKMQEEPHNAALHCEVGLIALRAGALDEGKRLAAQRPAGKPALCPRPPGTGKGLREHRRTRPGRPPPPPGRDSLPLPFFPLIAGGPAYATGRRRRAAYATGNKRTGQCRQVTEHDPGPVVCAPPRSGAGRLARAAGREEPGQPPRRPRAGALGAAGLAALERQQARHDGEVGAFLAEQLSSFQ